MSDLPRPRNLCDGLYAVKESEDNSGDSVPVADAGGNGDRMSAAESRSKPENSNKLKPGQVSSEGRGSPVILPLAPISPVTPISPSRGGISNISSPNSLHRYQRRSPLFSHCSRSSSGYFSFDVDSLPSSPLSPKQVVDKATQTPSPTSQAMTHALQRVSASPRVPEAPWRDNYHDGPFDFASRSRIIAGDMQAAILIGQELRNIGDQYNHLLMDRRAGRYGWMMQPNPPVNLHQEPAFLLCMGLLLLLGVLYLQGRGIQPP